MKASIHFRVWLENELPRLMLRHLRWTITRAALTTRSVKAQRKYKKVKKSTSSNVISCETHSAAVWISWWQSCYRNKPAQQQVFAKLFCSGVFCLDVIISPRLAQNSFPQHYGLYRECFRGRLTAASLFYALYTLYGLSVFMVISDNMSVLQPHVWAYRQTATAYRWN